MYSALEVYNYHVKPIFEEFMIKYKEKDVKYITFSVSKKQEIKKGKYYVV